MKLDGLVRRATAALPKEVRESFALDPLATLRDHFGLSVRAAEHLGDKRGTGGACDGMSYLDHGVILYAPSRFSNRQNFTLAHEFAHWLVENNDYLMGWIGEQRDQERVLETLCDQIAQRLLLPEDLVDEATSWPIRAQQVVDLNDQSVASLPVCAIAAAARLRGLGAIVVISRHTMEVTSATVHPDPEDGWPAVYPWTGDAVPVGHFLHDLGAGQSATRRSFWRDRWDRREDFFIDAVASDTQICAVLAGSDIWHVEPLPVLVDRTFINRPASAFQCCGEWREVRGFPCTRCGRGFCPVCGSCKCTKVASNEAECDNCHTITPTHLLQGGLCEMCA